MFIYAFFTAPLAQHKPDIPSITSPPGLLAVLFLVHYVNRAIISPLRTPSRSGHHLIVTLAGIYFNVQNGFMMGSYLSSPFSLLWFQRPHSIQRLEFKLGIAMWLFGFVGNVVHDEILLNIRRKANATGKSREKVDSNGQQQKGEHYAIPYGLLYTYVSYPNYFCEWIEWLGFALASGPLPFPPSTLSSLSFSSVSHFLSPPYLFQAISHIVMEPSSSFAPYLSPPWIFVLAEIVTMFPRAYKGHQWYKQKFGDTYPKDRKIVIPFLVYVLVLLFFSVAN
jgi:3-oxo-5-alpha-steroid 4-dehydrogenase 1